MVDILILAPYSFNAPRFAHTRTARNGYNAAFKTFSLLVFAIYTFGRGQKLLA